MMMAMFPILQMISSHQKRLFDDGTSCVIAKYTHMIKYCIYYINGKLNIVMDDSCHERCMHKSFSWKFSRDLVIPCEEVP